MKNLSIAFLAAVSIFSVGACKKKGGGDAGEAMAKVSEFKDKMCACKDAACATKVGEDYAKWGQEMTAKAPKTAPATDAESAKKMTEVMTAYTDCASKAMAAGGDMAGSGSAMAGDMAGSGSGSAMAGDMAGSGSAAPAMAGESTGIPECDEYRAAIDKLASCDKIPEAARKQMKDAFDQQAAAWKTLPAEAKTSAASACKAAADATKQSGAACGG